MQLELVIAKRIHTAIKYIFQRFINKNLKKNIHIFVFFL